MLAWANREAVERTLATGRAWFWSRSRGELWEKGATSGNTLAIVDVSADCDGDALLYRVHPERPRLPHGQRDLLGRAAQLPGSAGAHDRGAPRRRSRPRRTSRAC